MALVEQVNGAAGAYLTGPEQGTWLTRLDADQANLRRAAGYAVGQPDGTALVLRLGAALGWRYWLVRSREQEALDLLVPVFRRPCAEVRQPLCGPGLWRAGVVSIRAYSAAAARLIAAPRSSAARVR